MSPNLVIGLALCYVVSPIIDLSVATSACPAFPVFLSDVSRQQFIVVVNDDEC